MVAAVQIAQPVKQRPSITRARAISSHTIRMLLIVSELALQAQLCARGGVGQLFQAQEAAYPFRSPRPRPDLARGIASTGMGLRPYASLSASPLAPSETIPAYLGQTTGIRVRLVY